METPGAASVPARSGPGTCDCRTARQPSPTRHPSVPDRSRPLVLPNRSTIFSPTAATAPAKEIVDFLDIPKFPSPEPAQWTLEKMVDFLRVCHDFFAYGPFFTKMGVSTPPVQARPQTALVPLVLRCPRRVQPKTIAADTAHDDQQRQKNGAFPSV